jgi:(p)ppGpp synthase/HD superfamily hydrolase
MKSTTEILELAKKIAYRSHEGQVRRGTLVPYVEHPQGVAERLASDPELQIVAWLHDVLEDSGETAESLAAAGIPEHLVEAVVLLTREPNVSDETYYLGIRKSRIATAVKIADMISNLADQPTPKQIRRYAKGLLILTPETDE